MYIFLDFMKIINVIHKIMIKQKFKKAKKLFNVERLLLNYRKCYFVLNIIKMKSKFILFISNSMNATQTRKKTFSSR